MDGMNALEHFRNVMHFRPGVRTLMWEMGYWTATVERWYREGLRRSPYSPPPGFPAGSGVFAEANPFPHMPTQVRYRDLDIHRRCALDEGAVRIPINWRYSPPFKEQIIEEDETTRVMINTDGIKVRARKDSDSIPQFLAWPVHDQKSWNRIKEERFAPQIGTRFPQRWSDLVAGYRQRDYPLGVVLDGFFSLPREMLGLENQSMMYYDNPRLMHDINEHVCRVWLTVMEELLSQLDLDLVYFWEDMSFKNGPLLSPGHFEEFVVPYYKRMTDFLKSHGIDIIFVDTDGDCRKLIPGFIEGGVTGLYPFEVMAGMDVAEIRKQYPKLLMMGGVDKTKIAHGKEAIDAELHSKLPFVLSQGGYVPFCDHLVPPDVPWENFLYYRQEVQKYAEKYQPG